MSGSPSAATTQADSGTRGARRVLLGWWKPLDARAASVVAARVFAYDLDRRDALPRYVALLVLAVLMATFGLHKDSATIIISAMLLEQFMLPIVAFALALVTGQVRRQLAAGALIVASAVVAIALSWLVTELALSDRSRISSQLLATSVPTLSDLAVALIAGAAGGYVLTHRETLGALPGAAVGLSLVPPLCAAGYLEAHGDRGLAIGALLLFATNLAAIVFAAAAVFVLAGFLPIRDPRALPARIRISLLLSLVVVVAIAVPLQRITRAIVQNARDESAVLAATSAWAGETDFTIRAVTIDGDEVDVALSGPGVPLSVDDLAAAIAEGLGRPVTLEVEVFQTTTLTVTSAQE